MEKRAIIEEGRTPPTVDRPEGHSKESGIGPGRKDVDLEKDLARKAADLAAARLKGRPA